MFAYTFSIQRYMAVGVMVVAMFLGMTMSVVRAEASTVSELQAMVSQLMAQIAALQGVESETSSDTTTSTSTACEDFSRTLYLGSRDATTNGDVTRLQKFLTTTGHYTYGAPTGYYGPATAEAVQRWQKASGVVSSGTPDTTGYGMFGPSTRAKLRATCVGSETPVTPGTSPANISIESPRNGTDYLPGDYVTIKWNSKNLKNHTAVVTLKGNNVERHIARNINMDAGSARVKIPVSDALGAVTEGAYTLTLAIVNVKDGAPDDLRASVAIDITGEEEEIEEEDVDDIEVSKVRTSAVKVQEGKSGKFTITFDVTAGEEDIYLPNTPGYFGRPFSDENFVNFTLMKNGVALDGYKLEPKYAVSLTTTADDLGREVGYVNGVPVSTHFYHVEAGETEEFSLTVVFTPTDTPAAYYSMHLEGPLHYSLDEQTNDGDDKDEAFKEFATDTVLVGGISPTGINCMNDGVSYPEGTKRTSIKNADGTISTIADAFYVCRVGVWKIEGGLPKPTAPTTPTFTTTVSGLVLTTKFTLNNGCAGYTILWGDGTQTSRISAAQGLMCTQVVSNVVQEHTYPKAGTYTMTLKRFSGADQTSTETKTIIVGSVLGTYKGYMNGSLFITTRDISRADAVANCKLNAASNVGAKVYCTWNDVIVFDNRATEQVGAATTDVAPGTHHFACNRTLATKIGNGALGCYGMWDYGEAFGGDVDMCGTYGAGKTGCVIEAPVCSSGTAKATTRYAGSEIPTTKLPTMSTNLKTSMGVIARDVSEIWEYTCVAPEPVAGGAVLGASTTSIEESLMGLVTSLKTLLRTIQ